MPVLYEVPTKPKRVKTSKTSKVDGIFPQGGKLSAFIARPAKAHFRVQEEGEEIALLLRRHWATNSRWLMVALLMTISPLIFWFFPVLDFMPFRFQIMTIVLWYLLTIAFTFEQFLSWYFNVYIVTSERVVDLDFYNILYYNQAQADLNRITDMNFTVAGLGRLFFNYGDLVIETAGDATGIVFEKVPDPRKVMQIIEKLKP